MFERGSILWLLRRELTITWRTWFQRNRKTRRRIRIPVPVVAGVIALAAMAFLGVPVATSLSDTVLVATPLVSVIVGAALLLVFTLMLSQTLIAAVDVFYDRGDLDLLLSSPISPTRILIVRAIAIAVNPALLFWALITPFALPMIVLSHPEIAAAYVVIGAWALLATGLGLMIAIALFATIGPRRTRTVAQVLAALVGAGFVIAAQIPNIIARGDGGTNADWLGRLTAGGPFPEALTWPAAALFGSLGPLVLIVAIGFGVFTAIAIGIGRRFAGDAAAAGGADTARRHTGRRAARFGQSQQRATMAKELKLLLRDPGLLSQVLLRVFYIVPLAVVILTDTGDLQSLTPIIAAAASALLAGQLAGTVAWITLSAEDAPELLAASPVSMGGFWRSKLLVSLLVPAVLLSPVLILFAVFEPVAALIGAGAAAASAASAAMINLWLQKPSKRSDFCRSWSTTLGANVLELTTSLCFAAAAGLAVAGLGYVWIALAVAVGVLVLARRPEAAVYERMTAV